MGVYPIPFFIHNMETPERLVKIETAVEYIKENLDKHIEREDDMINGMDKKFSGKWVEKAVLAVLIAIAVGFAGVGINSCSHEKVIDIIANVR